MWGGTQLSWDGQWYLGCRRNLSVPRGGPGEARSSVSKMQSPSSRAHSGWRRCPCTGVPHPMLVPASTSRATWSSVATEVGTAVATGCSGHHLLWPCSSLLVSGGPITAGLKASPSPGFPVCCHEAGLGVLPPALPKWRVPLGKPCPRSAACKRFGPAVWSLRLG